MSLSNWKGSSGWLSLEDPTGVLNGLCLKVSSGKNQLCQDYLIQEIGTSNDFNKNHYLIQCDIASQNDNPFDGMIALAARVSDYTTDVTKPIIPQQGYICFVDFGNQKVSIVRKINAVNSLLSFEDLNIFLQPNTKNELSLLCYGDPESGGTTLSLKLNGSILTSFKDGSGLQILTGSVGIQVMNGTIYMNNFAVMELDSLGKAV